MILGKAINRLQEERKNDVTDEEKERALQAHLMSADWTDATDYDIVQMTNELVRLDKKYN